MNLPIFVEYSSFATRKLGILSLASESSWSQISRNSYSYWFISMFELVFFRHCRFGFFHEDLYRTLCTSRAGFRWKILRFDPSIAIPRIAKIQKKLLLSLIFVNSQTHVSLSVKVWFLSWKSQSEALHYQRMIRLKCCFVWSLHPDPDRPNNRESGISVDLFLYFLYSFLSVIVGLTRPSRSRSKGSELWWTIRFEPCRFCSWHENRDIRKTPRNAFIDICRNHICS